MGVFYYAEDLALQGLEDTVVFDGADIEVVHGHIDQHQHPINIVPHALLVLNQELENTAEHEQSKIRISIRIILFKIGDLYDTCMYITGGVEDGLVDSEGFSVGGIFGGFVFELGMSGCFE